MFISWTKEWLFGLQSMSCIHSKLNELHRGVKGSRDRFSSIISVGDGDIF